MSRKTLVQEGIQCCKSPKQKDDGFGRGVIGIWTFPNLSWRRKVQYLLACATMNNDHNMFSLVPKLVLMCGARQGHFFSTPSCDS
jgi:hypothetical protein